MIAAAAPPYPVLLLTTIAVETAIALALMWKHRARLRLDVPLLNCVTHPIATVLLRWGLLSFFPVEILIWLAEAFGYRTVTGLSAGRALLLSGVCNGVTMLIALAWL